MPSLARVSAALCLGLTLAACGSTVPAGQQTAVGGAGGDLGGNPAVPGAVGDVGTGTTGTAIGTTGGTTGAAATSGGVVSAPGSAGQAVDPGTAITRRTGPISVGIAYVKDAAAGFEALGIQGGTLGDMRLYSQILVDDINKRGGLAGRKIVPVFFAYDVNPGTPSLEQQDAQACATFTQDNHIEVGLVTFAGEGVYSCLSRKGIPMLQSGPTGGIGSGLLRKYPNLIVLGGFNLDRRATEEVHALVRQKYFSPWDTINGAPGKAPVKIGIITYDFPGWRESANGPLAQGVVAAGFAKPQVVAVAAHDSYDNLAKMQGQLSNAELSFRAAGVTHVIIWDDNGVSTLFFMQNAEKQGYRPRYGITSGNNMKLLSSGLVSERQLTGATGMGWVPAFDIPEADSPTSSYANSARRRCYSLMKTHQATGQGYNENSAMMYCAKFFALENRFKAMATPSPAGLVASLEAFGTSFVDPNVPSHYLSHRQHDGLGGIYDYFYSSACSCMQYSKALRPLARS
jgi:hypothetical protein